MCSDQVIKNREFARLKITESLAAMVGNSNANFANSIQNVVNGLNTGEKKWSQKVEKYSSIFIDIDLMKNNEIESYDVLTIRDILRCSDQNKLSYINDLMANFEFLLRDATIEGTRNGEEGNLTKE